MFGHPTNKLWSQDLEITTANNLHTIRFGSLNIVLACDKKLEINYAAVCIYTILYYMKNLMLTECLSKNEN